MTRKQNLWVKPHKTSMELLYEAGIYGSCYSNLDHPLRAAKGIIRAIMGMIAVWAIVLWVTFR